MTSFRAILVALLLLPVPAEAWVYYTSTSSGETVRWESGGPCTLAFQYHPEGIDSIPGMKEFTIFEDAMALWNANPCTDVVLTLDGVDDGCDIGAALGSEQNCIVVTDSGWVAAHPQSIGAAMLTILSYKPATGLLGDVDIDITPAGRNVERLSLHHFPRNDRDVPQDSEDITSAPLDRPFPTRLVLLLLARTAPHCQRFSLVLSCLTALRAFIARASKFRAGVNRHDLGKAEKKRSESVCF